jgi:class 3 adenylate cyclase
LRGCARLRAVSAPPVQYATNGDVHIAYRVLGEGPLDLVFVAGAITNLDVLWEMSDYRRACERLASFSRLILFDKRGTGMSDRVSPEALPTLEERMQDLVVVLDAVGSERAALFSDSEGGNLATLFAATRPDRTIALVTAGIFAKRIWSPDYPWAPTQEKRAQEYEVIEREWGNLMDLSRYIPSKIHDEAFARRLATYFRHAASPGAAVALLKMNTQIDIRRLLPTIRVPTLVMHRVGDLDASVDEGRWMAAQIPGARFVDLPGDDHLPWVGDQDTVLDEVQEFLTGVRPTPDINRVLATVLFTDIVGSTELAARIGDRAWSDLLDRHHRLVRGELARFRGREVNTAGDSFLATFDGPARGIRCALSVRDAVKPLGIQIRAGLHIGEIELDGNAIAGIAVHIGARVAASAGADEVLVSSTVKDLVSGSGIRFSERGAKVLKGVPGTWQLYAAA